MTGESPPRELLAQLQRDLAAALTVYLDKHEPTARPGLIAALGAVSEFIESIPDMNAQRLFLPLRALFVALDDLDRGHVHEFLRPKHVWDRKPNSFERQKIMMAGALALEGEFRKSRDLKKAATVVADLLREQGFRKTATPGPKGEITPKTVIDWRNRLNRGKKVPDWSAAIWKAFLRDGDAAVSPPEDPLQIIRRLPDHLKQLGTRNLTPE